MRVGITLIFFFLQTPGCHGNAAAAPLSTSPILDCLCARPEQKAVEKTNKKTIEEDENQDPQQQ